jgi:uncharacterized protein YciI
MLFAIHALDRAGALPTRLANYEAHKAFLSDASRFGISIVMSGSWLDEHSSTMRAFSPRIARWLTNGAQARSRSIPSRSG